VGGSPSSPPRDHVCTGAPMSPFRISGMVPESGPTRLGLTDRAGPHPSHGKERTTHGPGQSNLRPAPNRRT
jgi:hypothetical protein